MEFQDQVISIKILLNSEKISRGVGFIKMTNREFALKVINVFDGLVPLGCEFPIEARFANSRAQKEFKERYQ